MISSGISPLALIQETLVVQVFEGESMGLAVALGLVVGKAASFVSSFTTVPLALYTPLSYRTPFIVSTTLTLFSVLFNIAFVLAFSRPSNANALSNAEAHIRAHKTIAMKDIYAMSGLFWFYLVVCFLAGAVWTPFIQLSSTIIKHRFAMQDVYAADYASIILFIPIVLYPLVGWFTDRYGRRLSVCIYPSVFVLSDLVLFCSVSSLACYILLLIPATVLRTPLVAITCFAVGFGPAPLLLVIIAPFLTEHISTALGLHKSLEMAGSTLMQTVFAYPLFELMVSTPGYCSILSQRLRNWLIPQHFENYTLYGYLSHSTLYTSYPISSSFDWIRNQTMGMWNMQNYMISKKGIKHWKGKRMGGNII
jgi:nitrate/nitrite transporter NarK